MRHGYLLALIAVFAVMSAGAAHARNEAVPAEGQTGESAPAEAPAPTPNQAAEIDKYIAQLGDTDYKKREEAYDKLKAIGAPALEKLKEALKNTDAEVRASAQRLIEEIQGPRNGEGPDAPAVQILPGGNIRIIIQGGIARAAMPPPAEAEVVRQYTTEETVEKTKIKYDFTDRDAKGIDVAITKTDADGKATSETKHFDGADDMKTKDEALYKQYLKAQEAGVVAQMGGLGKMNALAAIGRLLEVRLKVIEGLQDADARDKMLKSVEDELLQGLKMLDATEKKVNGRSVKNALDFDSWALRPACALTGVQVKPVDEALKAQLNIKGGLLVCEIAQGSPYAESLKTYDIITQADGAEVNTVEALNDVCAKAAEKEKIEVKIIRGGKEETVSIAPPKVTPPNGNE